MCISNEQYDVLLKTAKDGRDQSRENCTKLEGVETKLKRVDEAVYGNGSAGLRTEIEVIKVKLGLKTEHIEEMTEQKLGMKLDWKTIGMIAIAIGQAIIVATLVSK